MALAKWVDVKKGVVLVPTTVKSIRHPPTSWYLPRRNRVKAVNCPISVGMVPVNGIEPFNLSRKACWEHGGQEPIDGMRLPTTVNLTTHLPT